MNNSNQHPASLTDIFGPPISIYTRARAIADGVLVEVPELDAALAGFVIPFACNASVWGACNAAEQNNRAAMLRQCRVAIDAIPRSDDRVYFELSLPEGGTLSVVLHCGPGDAAEPVLTLCETRDL